MLVILISWQYFDPEIKHYLCQPDLVSPGGAIEVSPESNKTVKVFNLSVIILS